MAKKMLAIKEMEMPTNCAHCPILSITYGGVKCGTPVGEDKRICSDSLYFDNFRPKWCPLTEVEDADNR